MASILHDTDILCISSIDWDFIWQGHQEIMAILAAHGNRVLFVENTGVRAPGLKDLGRLKQRLRNWWHSTKGFRQVRDTLFVYSPLILPFPYSRLARWINYRLLLRALQRWMHAMEFHRPIVWTFLPTPLVRDLIRAVDADVTVYYCIDDLASSSPQARRISRSETQLFREADLVFVTSEKLRQRAARFNERVWLFPFGVDFEEFERMRLRTDGLPDELRHLPGPIVGYVGGLHQWVDQDLLASLMARMSDASFVFVGPAQTDVSRLARYPNAHLLGAKSHEEVPRYIKGFSVAIIPYRLSDYTAHVYPTKLNEYLAMGVPVVATKLPEVERFVAEHGDVIAVAEDASGFQHAIQQALTVADRHAAGARRVEVARQNSWSCRIAQMSTLIEERLSARRETRERWDTSLRRLYRVAHQRLTRAVLVGVAAYLLLFQSPVMWWVAEPLRVAHPPRLADAIVVFAGGVGESGKAGGGYQERVKRAVDLYREGYAQHLIFSSGYTFVFQEAEVMKELAVANGVSPTSILLERRARNTYENVVFTANLLRQHRWRSVLLVSSPYHMRRALLTWRKMAPEAAVIPTPVPESQFYAHRRGVSLEQLRGILHEYVAILVYCWRGWI